MSSFSCLVASPFLPPTLSPFHFLQIANRLMCFSPSNPFSSSLKTLERFSRRKRALTFRTSVGCAWVLLLTVYQFGVFTQTASPPNHNSPRGDRNLVFVVGLSPRAADVVKGMYPAPDIHEHLRYTNGYGKLRTSSRTT